MARLRSELLALAIPVALCLAAWVVIVSRPASNARHVPSPRERVTLERHPQRPPSPAPRTLTPPPDNAAEIAPHAEADSHAATPAASNPSTSDTVIEVFEISGIGVSEGWSEDYWNDSSYRWERWLYYARRDWELWRRNRRAAIARRVRSTLMPGSAGDYDDDASSPVCAVFTSACRVASSRRPVSAPAPSAPDAEPATLRREGQRWTLSNRTVEATIDPSALCAIALSRRIGAEVDALPPLSVATPSAAPCTVSATMVPDTSVERGGVAVAITWEGDGWSQRAVLSLMDDATSPELSVARSERIGARIATTVTNLTASPLTWTLSGRDVTVPSARTATFNG